jgi:hypothetical protein
VVVSRKENILRWVSLSSIVIVAAIITSAAASAGVLGKGYAGVVLGRVDSDLGADGTFYGVEVRLPTSGPVDLVGAFARTDFKYTHVSAAGER